MEFVQCLLSTPSLSCASATVEGRSNPLSCSNFAFLVVSPDSLALPLPRVPVPVWICLPISRLSPPDVLFLHHKWNHSPCTKLASTLLPVCNSGCPTTICKNRCSPSLLCSITSSLNRFVNTFPGSGGIVTRALSRSSISRKYSKSE